MIISTNNLNNIENKITTLQIEGIEFIIGTDINGSIELNASYNDIINILEIGKLPVIKYNNEYLFIKFIGQEFYGFTTINDGYFSADNTTTNLRGSLELA